jgi:integrase/recombinase XerD
MRRAASASTSSATATSGITSIYLQGIDNAEIIETVHARRAPMIPVSTSLRP